MKFILGTKQNMTQYFGEDGRVVPATIVSAGPIVVTQIKTVDTDGYTAVQVGYLDQKKERVSKAVLGHLKETGAFKHLKEFRVTADFAKTLTIGDKVDLTAFTAGDPIEVTAVSKGKGFQGVIKRHGFKGGPRTHGQKHSEREPGSIGGGLRSRVPKGMRMAGRMGNDTTTVKNLEIVTLDPETNTVLIKGAIPGRRGSLVEIRG